MNQDNKLVIGGLAAVAAGVILYSLFHNQNKHHLTEEEIDSKLRERVKRRSEQELENMMIKFKRENPRGTFKDFMADHFQENIKREGNNIILDPSVRNHEWEGRFERVKASQPFHELGPLPID